jgi:hypothetical protein
MQDWQEDQLVLSIRALSPIPAHTELTLSYLGSNTQPQAVRQAEILRKYKFVCACAGCALPAAESDVRRKRLGLGNIDEVRWERWRASPPTTRDGMMQTVHACWAVLNDAVIEGLAFSCFTWTIHADWLARAAAALGDRDQFKNAATIAMLGWRPWADDGRSATAELYHAMWVGVLDRFHRGEDIPGWGVLGPSWITQM